MLLELIFICIKMTKKIILILGILVIVGIAGFLMLGGEPQTEGESRVGFSLRNYLPFGSSDNVGSEEEVVKPKEENLPTIEDPNKPLPRLRKLSKEPVAGAVVFNTGTTSVVRFVEKGTGNVYEATSDSLAIKRLTNTTIRKIIRAFWIPSGAGFLAQTLIPESEIIETNFVKLNKVSTSTLSENLTPFSTTISKLPTGIKELTIKPDGTKIFYYTVSGNSRWFVANPDGTGATLLLSHPLTEWLPKWVSPNIVSMQQKSSAQTENFYYSFDTSSKVLKKTGVGVVGLSANSNNDGSSTLVSSGGKTPRLFLINNKNFTSINANTNTLADKCVWSKKEISVYCAIPNQIPNGAYPDDWYRGTLQTEDFLKKIDLNNIIYYNTADLSKESGEKIDVVDIMLSPDDTHLIFRNKTDGFLWLLRIED